MMASIGQRIGEARRAAGLTQEGLARQLGLAGATVARWEQGRHEPDLTTLRRVAATLGVKTIDLVGDDALAAGADQQH